MLSKKLEKYVLTFVVVASVGLFSSALAKTVHSTVTAVTVEQRSSVIVKQMKKLGFYCWKCDVRIKRDVEKLKNVRYVRVTKDHKLIIGVKGPIDMKAVKQIIVREAYEFV